MHELPAELKEMIESSRVRNFPKGQIIHYEGDAVNDIYIIKSGIVRVYDTDDQSNEKVLHIVKSPALIPFAFFISEGATTEWFYSALTDCDVYILDQRKLRDAMLKNGELAVYLLRNFSNDVHELLVRLSSLGKTTASDKVIAVLTFLVVCHGNERPSGWWRIPFPVSHQLLADMVGITRESVAVVMKDLQDNKIIRNPRLTTLEVNKDRLLLNKQTT
jgi:CRP-like cAMP-binding protein